MYLQTYLEKFKKEHDYQSFEIIMNYYFPDAKKCRECEKHIFYKDTAFIGWIMGNKVEIIGKSFQSTKAHGETLEVCEECVKNKFKEYDENKKIFNTLNKITLFAFNIKDKKPYITGVTKEKLIKKYGEIDGLKINYCLCGSSIGKYLEMFDNFFSEIKTVNVHCDL